MKKLFTGLFLAIGASAFAQTGALDTSFNVGTGFASWVNTAVVQSDGKIIVGGNFTSFDGAAKNRMARLNADGTLEAAFNSGTSFNSQVRTASIQSDGKIIAGGDFSQIDGVARRYIARLNADGTLDTTFNTSTGFNDWVYSTAIQADGKVVVGGMFANFNGTSTSRIARLNTDGTLDTTFNTGTGFGGTINAIAVQTDGKIIAGGYFPSFNGTTKNNIARLNANGSLDTTFNIGTAFNDAIRAISIQADGKIIVAGYFTTFNGTAKNRIVRLNTDGTLDATFTINTGFNAEVTATAIQNDGKIVAAGNFTQFNGTNKGRIARLNTNGTVDTTFNPTGTAFDATINTTAVQADGKIIAGGYFTNFNGSTQNYIARLLSTTIVGVSENTPNAAVTFDVYPNPTNATVSVSLPDALLGQKISLLNTIGQVLETKNITATTMSYDLAHLANGIYFIQVQTNKGIVTKKVVKH